MLLEVLQAWLIVTRVLTLAANRSLLRNGVRHNGALSALRASEHTGTETKQRRGGESTTCTVDSRSRLWAPSDADRSDVPRGFSPRAKARPWVVLEVWRRAAKKSATAQVF